MRKRWRNWQERDLSGECFTRQWCYECYWRSICKGWILAWFGSIRFYSPQVIGDYDVQIHHIVNDGTMWFWARCKLKTNVSGCHVSSMILNHLRLNAVVSRLTKWWVIGSLYLRLWRLMWSSEVRAGGPAWAWFGVLVCAIYVYIDPTQADPAVRDKRVRRWSLAAERAKIFDNRYRIQVQWILGVLLDVISCLPPLFMII